VSVVESKFDKMLDTLIEIRKLLEEKL